MEIIPTRERVFLRDKRQLSNKRSSFFFSLLFSGS